MTSGGTISLAPAIVDAVGADIPVVAAGGIADGRGLAAALTLGCSGILMGTRFIASREAVDTEDRKAALLKAKGDDTIRSEIFDLVWSGSPWPESFNGRAVRNVFVDRWLGNEANLKEHLTEEHARLMEFNARGDLSGGIVWAGESVDLISSILPADTIVEQTVRDAIEMLTGKSTFTLVNSS